MTEPVDTEMKDRLLRTQERISPHVHRTAILRSTTIDEMVGAELLFKCENFQRMGAFKMRGATNAILSLSEEERAKGVVTHSSGNFAQAVSLAAKSLGVRASIVMPSTATGVKVAAVKGYKGEVTICEPTLEARQSAADRIVQETGATFIHPSNDMDVIVGNATAAMELIEDHPDLAVIFTPVGGGGLVAGTALAAHHFGNGCEVIGGEPASADDAYRSLASGRIEGNATAETIADGLRTTLGDINFPIIQQHVDRIVRVNEEEIIEAMRLVWTRMKIIIEPSSAVALAAVIKEKEQVDGKQIGLIVSGGNVDVERLPF